MIPQSTIPPHVEEVPRGEPPSARAQPPAASTLAGIDARPSMRYASARSSNGNPYRQATVRPLTYLDQRVRTHASLDKIHEFFFGGPGTRFPAWVLQYFLGRIARCTAGDLPSTSTATGDSVKMGGPDAVPKSDRVTETPPAETTPTPARQSITRPTPTPQCLGCVFTCADPAFAHGAF